MRYRDLINFEPIESVVELRDANAKEYAREKIEDYVISDRMAQLLAAVLIPQLQFHKSVDNKGILIVGNYGTGKSHLMSVISGVAEHEDLAGAITNKQVRAAATEIAGRFQVARVELGAVKGDLRDIIVREIEKALRRWGIEYTFPSSTQITNNKDGVIAAMGMFHERFPDHGFLLVVDELLDFLKGRDGQQQILDLGFLRELGEVVGSTRFRFIAGLQEALFDSPSFRWVGPQLQRIRDRFEQISIARDDIAFVVANRLLKKSDQQIALATEYLRPYAHLYDRMAEGINEYARLFPIHPAYIDTFEAIHVIEKRQVLVTFSRAIQAVLDLELPADQPGIISYDHYHPILADNPSMRTNEAVAKMLDKTGIIRDRVDQNFERKHLLPLARRLINGLGILRLTTESIDDPIGSTPKELRDNLTLYLKTPANDADFLADQVRITLNEIMRTVSGQYITHLAESDQYFIDIKKDIDFDQLIDDRGASLSPDQLNRAYFTALAQILGLDTGKTYVSNYNIWFHEIPWAEKRVTRPGYLFFGAPAQRSTAQPERDFYLYLLPPFGHATAEETRDDELTFSLEGAAAELEPLIRRFGGASELQASSATHKKEFGQKAEDALRKVAKWLDEKMADHLRIGYLGTTEPVRKALGGAPSTQSGSLQDIVRIIASAKLRGWFGERYPDYPAFPKLSQPVTEQSRPATATEALRGIAGQSMTNQMRAVLGGLGMLDDEDKLRPGNSSYAAKLLAVLTSKPIGHVVNRSEIIENLTPGVDRPVEKDRIFRLEPEWIAVLLAGLAYNGEIVITLDKNETVDAGTIERLATTSVERLAGFQHYASPKEVPIRLWEDIFTGLELAPGLIRDQNKHEDAVRELQATVSRSQTHVADLLAKITPSLNFWNEPIFADNKGINVDNWSTLVSTRDDGQVLTSALTAGLRGYKQYLETLARYNTRGKLRNLQLDSGDIATAAGYRKTVERAQALVTILGELQQRTTYFAQAEALLSRDDPWVADAVAAKISLLVAIRSFARGETQLAQIQSIKSELQTLQQRYIARYAELHSLARLGPSDDARKAKLADDERLTTLKELAKIDLLAKNKTALDGWTTAAAAVKSCKDFHAKLLDASPRCTCGFSPAAESAKTSAAVRLFDLEARLDAMLADWRTALTEGLKSPIAAGSLANMTAVERAPIDAFLVQAFDDPGLPPGFVKAARDALKGISAVAMAEERLVTALRAGGLPCTVAELKRRFDAFVAAEMKGHPEQSTRVTLSVAEDGEQA